MADTQTDPHEQALATANVEPSDISFKGVAITTGILVLVIVLVCWGVLVLFLRLANQARSEDQADRTLAHTIHQEQEKATLEQLPLDRRLPPAPTLEGLATPPAVSNPLPLVQGLGPTQPVGKPLMSGVPGWPSQGPEQAARETRELETLAWVNEKEGIVRLPMDQVIKKLAGTMPVRSSEPPRDRTPHYRTPSDANSGRPPVGAKP
jgi:hypothetical protein